MRLAEIFHAVKSGSTEEKVAFWRLCKTAATANGGSAPVGLAKIAFDIWADSYERGLHPKSDRSTREAFAGSFGSAVAVEGEIAKLAAQGQISEDEQTKMAAWVAESAVRDLTQMTKSASPVADFLKRPRVLGTLAGTAVGAGVGAWRDDEDRLRGALLGAVPGALVGGAIGHNVGAQRAAAEAAEELKHQMGQALAHGKFDQLIHAANQMEDPGVRQHLESKKHELLRAFAQGSENIPDEVISHLPAEERHKLRTIFSSGKFPSQPKAEAHRAATELQERAQERAKKQLEESHSALQKAQREASEHAINQARARTLASAAIVAAEQSGGMVPNPQSLYPHLVEHFEHGHTTLPEHMVSSLNHDEILNLNRDFQYHARGLVGGTRKKSSLQSKLADIMQGLDQGGQPPMNADAPPGMPGPQGMQGAPGAEGEAIAEPEPGVQDGMEDLDKAHKVVDNMIFLAQQVQMPQLAQEMEQMRDQLVSHFADGHAYLPAELQHNFAQSEHAEAFMKKYKQRFGTPSVGGSKKAAGFLDPVHRKIEEWRGLAPGGVNMDEVRKRLPDAEYIGMRNAGAGMQPAIMANNRTFLRTWDPETVRHVRASDPSGFYQTFSRIDYPPGMGPSGAENAPKTASYNAMLAKAALFGFGRKPVPSALPELPPDHEIHLSDPVDYPTLHLSEDNFEGLTPEHANQLLAASINYSPETHSRLYDLSNKAASDRSALSVQDDWLSWRTHR
jgi:hypothetical protein